MKVDFIIVGGGIAGSCLAYRLLSAGKKIAVFDDKSLGAACLVAAGVINPITGKRLVKSWRSSTAHPYAKSFYSALESGLGAKFYHERKILQLCLSCEESSLWRERAKLEDYAPYVGRELPPDSLAGLNDRFGSRFVEHSAWVETPVLMRAFEKYLTSRGAFVREKFSYDALKISRGTRANIFSCGDVVSEKIVFCEGWRAIENPYFKWLPYRPAKGDILTLRTDGYELPPHIIHRGKWLMRTVSDARNFRMGSTWDRENFDAEPTPSDEAELLAALKNILSADIHCDVLARESGVRPCTATTRPHIGEHPSIGGMYSFNGFGSKGFALSPLFSEEFADTLLNNVPIDVEANLSRHIGKFFPREVVLSPANR